MKLGVVAEKLGLSFEHGVPTGQIKGYPYYVTQVSIDTFIKVPMMTFVFEKTLEKEHVKAIQKAVGMQQIRIESVVLNQNAVHIMFKHGIKQSDKHQAFLDKVADAFKDQGLKALNHCPFCGLEETDSHRIVMGAVVKVHDACAKNFYQELTERVEQEEKSNDNLVKSLGLAVVGAIAGAIPIFISIVFFQYMLALLYALIPLGSFYGYKFGKAARKSWVPAAVSIISLVIVLSLHFWLYNAIAAFEGISLADALNVADFRSAFISDLLTNILFLAIGIWISWRQMYKQTTGAVKKSFSGLNK